MMGLLLLILVPFVLIIFGVIQTESKDERKRKRGKQILLAGLIILGIEVLIGYAICSNIRG